MAKEKAIQPLISDLPKVWVPVESLSWDKAREELARIELQFKMIHDMPKLGDQKPVEYMHDALEGLRGRTIALHDRCNEILSRKKPQKVVYLR